MSVDEPTKMKTPISKIRRGTFPAYMYLYDVLHEAEIERRLQRIKDLHTAVTTSMR